MSDPQHTKYPLLPLAQHIFNLSNPSAAQPVQQQSLSTLQDAITEHKMAPLYRYLAHPAEGILDNAATPSTSSAAAAPASSATSGRRQSAAGIVVASRRATPKLDLAWDESLFERLTKENDEELAALKKEEEEAAEKAGDTEVQAAQSKRAEFFARIGDKDRAISTYEEIFEKTGILGTKIDLVLAIIRMGLFYGDRTLVKTSVARAQALVESGGDWDRRNRLKAYHGVYLLTVRSYNLAAPLLLDSLSTFTSYELCTYSSLVVYAVLAGSVSLKRVDFKSKVVDAPEIKAILGSGEDRVLALSGAVSAGPGGDDAMQGVVSSATPGKAAVNLTTLGSTSNEQAEEQVIDFSPLAKLMNSLYNGEYRGFFGALANVETNFLSQDRYLYEHRGWFIREMRLRAYQQLLQSYRVVGLDDMANRFGVSVDFLDRDLAKFIAAERIPCTIDRVTGRGVIETNRPDDKNKQYTDVVKQGDQLITKLQKYGQAVRLRGSERA